ncbi:hypothetical protein LTR66_008809 [Elasticomyces elasticus]|nr:hypothetical protein LTR66_008809 [Elasticomyces elasticus]KAK4992864.1 hypothetical protein LTR50_000770 [Elasticomyces elasticus]
MADKLAELKASAGQQYSLKNYAAAADIYSEATELQASINGEMSPENGDLLYCYGRCLYHVAVSKSDVLGGKVAGEKAPSKKRTRSGKKADTGSSANENHLATAGQKPADSTVKATVGEKEGIKDEKKEDAAESKPFFQITGDENWTDSDDSGAEADDSGAEESEAEDDEFALAFEILDLARLLLYRKVEQLESQKADEIKKRQVEERLADTHDLQAEISLENERFVDAITDFRSSLKLKKDLFPKESSLLAEAHYKLSLALEFASVTSLKTGGEESSDTSKEGQVDESMRQEAARETEAAIESCKLRLEKEKRGLPILDGAAEQEKKREIKEVDGMIEELQQRLIDLRNPAVSLTGATGPAGAPDGSNPLQGILGSILGESSAAQMAKIEDAMKNANDLSGMIRHKKGKRKLGGETAQQDGSDGKKAKMEDGGPA